MYWAAVWASEVWASSPQIPEDHAVLEIGAVGKAFEVFGTK